MNPEQKPRVFQDLKPELKKQLVIGKFINFSVQFKKISNSCKILIAVITWIVSQITNLSSLAQIARKVCIVNVTG